MSFWLDSLDAGLKPLSALEKHRLVLHVFFDMLYFKGQKSFKPQTETCPRCKIKYTVISD